MTPWKQILEYEMQSSISERGGEYRRADALSAISGATSRLFKPSLLSNETLLLLLFHLNEHHHERGRLASLVDQVACLSRWSVSDFEDFKTILIATIEDILIESGWEAFTFDESNHRYVLTGSLAGAILAPLYGFMDADLSSIKARHQVTLSALKAMTSNAGLSPRSTFH